MKVAIRDDYQNVALELADWSSVASRAEITVFNDHAADPDAVVERLLPFDVIYVMRERTPLRREIIERLPRLRLIASTGRATPRLTWRLPGARHSRHRNRLPGDTHDRDDMGAHSCKLAPYRSREQLRLRRGWQTSIGRELDGKVLGVLGLGNIGRPVACIDLAFGMKVIAWSQNLTPEVAEAAGATLVSKDELFRQADVVTIHLMLRKRPPHIQTDQVVADPR